MRKKLDLIKTLCVVLMLVAMLVCQILRRYRIVTLFDVSIVIISFGVIGLIIYVIDRVLSKKIDKFDILMFLLMIFGIIATIFAVDIHTSLFGFNNRNEGLFVIITYYIVFLLTHTLENKKCKKIIIYTILLYGAFNSLYAALQYFKVKKIFGIEVIRLRYYSTGFEQNPNFLGSIMAMCLPLSLSNLFLIKEKRSYIYFVFAVISFMGLLTCGAMSSLVAIIIILPVLLLLIFIKRDKKNKILLKLSLILIAFFLCFMKFNMRDNNYLYRQLLKVEHETMWIANGKVKDKYGTGRVYIWRRSLDLASHNLMNGVGIDNFYNAFDDTDKVIDVKSGYIVDKAHNEYLQKLVTEGIFSLVVYLFTLLVIFIMSLKKIIKSMKNNNPMIISLFMAFLAYCIQAFFNISVITVAPIFYIVMGLLISEVTYETT